MATARSILQVVESFQKSRTLFARTIAELALKPQNVEILHNAGVLVLLRPLLLDCIPQIQQLAALGLSRLANYSEELAEVFVTEKILQQVLFPLRDINRHNKKAAANVLRAVAKHTAPLAQAVVESGALEPLVHCLEEFDPSVKEAGASTLANIARHNARLAQAVADARAIGFLILCVQEPEIALRTAAGTALSEIAKHTPELSQVVIEAGATPHLAALLTHNDFRVKRVGCLALSQLARHVEDQAEAVVEQEIFPKMFGCLKDQDPQLRRNGATLIREVVKHSAALAQLVVGAGGLSVLIENISDTFGNERLPGIMAVGYIGAFDEMLSSSVIASGGVAAMVCALVQEHEDHIKSASAWALGQIGKHGPVHALAVAEAGALPHLVATFLSKTSSEDLQSKCKKALKNLSDRLSHLPALDSLLQVRPSCILKYVLGSLAKVLAADSDARAKFVTSGGFEKLQNLAAEPGTELRECIDLINSVYPVEIVHYYSPGYSEVLLKKLTGAKPAIPVG
ncbi:hypothetical protein SELMODRAFT_77299 [Selaginella moellendorffii]|uniref:Sperm-associated antigen 6 n=1 Tax=Selaginella moellendorffii TaxID=88036 RepID=D8QRA8_SELML|nr:hypothetical protein SELMODRAFT_95293 [Selaginella moellendorffii]EFJ37215.1 hypothetical protein SELMODRAFT_77299 [Selaginella moellendorffii]